ncbi:hypothetical protein FJTKL_03050 [Diaporthe vaccinii]|uniref:Uncharacterized protein n=1 Tax=Diaporthe vaccinii TaxID=105482 RepID=A0ABR4DW64_9PEZI
MHIGRRAPSPKQAKLFPVETSNQQARDAATPDHTVGRRGRDGKVGLPPPPAPCFSSLPSLPCPPLPCLTLKVSNGVIQDCSLRGSADDLFNSCQIVTVSRHHPQPRLQKMSFFPLPVCLARSSFWTAVLCSEFLS